VFDRIVLRRSENGSPVSFGEIAEALVFYRHVHVILDRGTLLELLKKIGIDNFFSLLELERVSAVYIDQNLGALTQRAGLADQYSFVAFSLAGSEPRKLSRRDRVAEIFVRSGCEKRQANRLAERLLAKVKVKSVTRDDFVPGGIIEAARADVLDSAFVRTAIACAINAEIPGAIQGGKEFDFEVIDFGRHFQVATNIDLKRLNAMKGGSDRESEVTIASLLAAFLTARADLALAAHYGCDFKTSLLSSEILRAKNQDLLRRSGINSAEMSEFKEVVLTDLPSLSEVLDQGQRTPKEFFDLFGSTTRFASWTTGLNPDEKLVAGYLREATAIGWIGTLSGKSVRFVIGLAVGTVNPAVGALASLADTFAVDRLLGGWRPSHFVDRKLKPFLQG
jgi:hypothetical protein